MPTEQEPTRGNTETKLQTVGGLLRVTGTVAGFVVAFAAYMYRQFAHEPFPYEWVLFALGACMVAVIVGMLEKMLGQMLAPVRQDVARLVVQVAAVEQKVEQLPGYGDGVVDGARLGVKLAEQLAADHPHGG